MKKKELWEHGVAVIGALVQNPGTETRTAVIMWERDAIAMFPDLKTLGTYTDHEQRLAEDHIRMRIPDFSLATGSTYFHSDDDINSTITEAIIRLDRLQHAKLKARSGPKPRDLEKQIQEAARLRKLPGDISKSEATRQAIEKHGYGNCASEKTAFDTIRKSRKLD